MANKEKVKAVKKDIKEIKQEIKTQQQRLKDLKKDLKKAKKESEVRKLIRFLQENIQRFPVSSESWYWYFILPLM